jgi:hypothetical protein
MKPDEAFTPLHQGFGELARLNTVMAGYPLHFILKLMLEALRRRVKF